MVGREVLIMKGPLVEIQEPGSRRKTRRTYTGSLYSGYFGTIKYSSEGANLYGIYLEATRTIVQVQKDIVVDRL
jgi:hypothetical protein